MQPLQQCPQTQKEKGGMKIHQQKKKNFIIKILNLIPSNSLIFSKPSAEAEALKLHTHAQYPHYHQRSDLW